VVVHTVVPATQEAEVGGSLEAEFETSLDNIVKSFLKRKVTEDKRH
jgi:hypothetical protein